MAGEDDGQDKTEEPTQKRLADARKEGQVPRSRELGGAAMLGLTVLLMYYSGANLAEKTGSWLAQALSPSRDQLLRGDPILRTGEMLLDLFWYALPLMLVGVLAGALAPLVLGGFNFSGKALAPKFSKLDPIAGFKRLFGAEGAVETVKAVVRVTLIVLVGVLTLRAQMPELISLLNEPLPRAAAHGVIMALTLLAYLTAALVLVAMIDAPFQLWNHRRKLKMTRQQLRQEFKESEGSPELKARIRRVQQEVANRRMMDAMPTADALIVNPTHYAVAIVYDASKNRAPKVVAKGVDLIALTLRDLADKYRIPIVEAPPLARALYRDCELEQEVPVRLYAAVAQVLGFVYQLRTWRKQGGVPPAKPEIVLDDTAAEPIEPAPPTADPRNKDR
jgi:flagellar biosynthetic protein FlhB